MDFVGYGIICLIFSMVSNTFSSGMAKNVLNSVAAKGMVELCQSMLKRILPKSFFYTKHHKTKSEEMLEEINQRLDRLTEKDVEELVKFFDGRKLKLPRELKNKFKEGGVDLADAISADADKTEKFVEAISACFIKMYKEARNEQTSAIGHKSPDDIVREIFCLTADDHVPGVVSDLAYIIYRQVYSQLYIELTADSRSLSKVMQCMLYENNETLKKQILDDIMPYMQMIEMQNQNCDFSALKGIDDPNEYTAKLTKLKKSDPYSFIVLKCHNCGHAGEWLERKDDVLICHACGSTTAVVMNVNDIKETIENATVMLLEKSKKASGEMRKELTLMAQRLVGKEYFALKVEQLKADIEDSNEAIKKALNERAEAAINRFKTELADGMIKTADDVKGLLDKKSKEIKDQLNEIQNKLADQLNEATDQVIGEVREIKTALSRGNLGTAHEKFHCPYCDSVRDCTWHEHFVKCTACLITFDPNGDNSHNALKGKIRYNDDIEEYYITWKNPGDDNRVLDAFILNVKSKVYDRLCKDIRSNSSNVQCPINPKNKGLDLVKCWSGHTLIIKSDGTLSNEMLSTVLSNFDLNKLEKVIIGGNPQKRSDIYLDVCEITFEYNDTLGMFTKRRN